MKEDIAALAKLRLEEILSFFGVNATATVEETKDGLELSVETPDGAGLIGHHGETLRSIQYLINMIVKENSRERVFVSVDISGYKKARAATLAAKALEAAEAVVATGEERVLAPMNAADRRLVHMALAERPEVTTESRGQDPRRQVVIKLKDV